MCLSSAPITSIPRTPNRLNPQPTVSIRSTQSCRIEIDTMKRPPHHPYVCEWMIERWLLIPSNSVLAVHSFVPPPLSISFHSPHIIQPFHSDHCISLNIHTNRHIYSRAKHTGRRHRARQHHRHRVGSTLLQLFFVYLTHSTMFLFPRSASQFRWNHSRVNIWIVRVRRLFVFFPLLFVSIRRIDRAISSESICVAWFICEAPYIALCQCIRRCMPHSIECPVFG